jgi:NADH-quinone oxidoreductase subunit M
MMFGPLDQAENRGLIDLNFRERVVVMLLVVPIFWVGLYPNPILRRIEPSVSLILNAMSRAVENPGGVEPDTELVVRIVPSSETRP